MPRQAVTGVTVRKRWIRVNISDFFVPYVTLKFDGWPWKTMGHLFRTKSSFVHHFKARWIPTGFTVRKRSIRVKIGAVIFVPGALKFDRWPWKTIGHLFYTTSSFVCALFQSHGWIQTGVTVQKHSIRVKISDFFVLCDLEIWQMTLENIRAPLLRYFQLCASFRSHWWI